MTPPPSQSNLSLEEMALRCEYRVGPDRDIDGWIAVALEPDRQTVVGGEPGRFPQVPIYGRIGDVMRDIGGNDGADYINAPAYTASLDAAMTLVPEGMDWCLAVPTDEPCDVAISLARQVAEHHGNGATPALALCAAALRARKHLQDKQNEQ